MPRWLNLLGELLSPEVLELARQEDEKGLDPVTFLIKENLIEPKVLLDTLSKNLKIPYLELELYHPDEDAVSKISEETARRLMVLPLFQIDSDFYVAISDPENLHAQDHLRHMTGLSIYPVLATRLDIEAAINKFFLTPEKSAKAMGAFAERTEKAPAATLPETELVLEDEEAPAIKLLNYIFYQAVNLGASDIHLEAFADHTLLRYRVDGVLHEFPPPPLHLYRAVVSRIKILSNLDVAEKRLPQDGRTTIQVNERNYDLRISILPNLHGEGVVIRILDLHGMLKELEELGFEPAMLKQYMRLVGRPYGILLITGPTGSGKTTTLYATLKKIYTPKKKIITLEEPVEYQLDGITQVPIRSEIGLTFAVGLRSVLRHDPDIIMLGEIRDLESAEIAVRSSLTGHFVFSTLHTNDSPSAIIRLIDMGIPAYLIYASLIGVIAQRLLRKLCPKCKEAFELSPEELSALDLSEVPSGATVYRPVGCTACGNLGYKGRIGIYELLEITGKMRHLSAENTTLANLQSLGREKGYKTLRESALEKFFAGLTGMEEVLNINLEKE